jgi:DNA-binding transcriptional regulator YiaG
LSKRSAKAEPMANGHDDESADASFRFSAKGLASHRKRLGLSAHDCGLLLGASGQSVYKWEEGEVRPRAKHMPAIAALRAMGKKEAAARLAQLR